MSPRLEDHLRRDEEFPQRRHARHRASHHGVPWLSVSQHSDIQQEIARWSGGEGRYPRGVESIKSNVPFESIDNHHHEIFYLSPIFSQ